MNFSELVAEDACFAWIEAQGTGSFCGPNIAAKGLDSESILLGDLMEIINVNFFGGPWRMDSR
jgi:hypothetical protein